MARGSKNRQAKAAAKSAAAAVSASDKVEVPPAEEAPPAPTSTEVPSTAASTSAQDAAGSSPETKESDVPASDDMPTSNPVDEEAEISEANEPAPTETSTSEPTVVPEAPPVSEDPTLPAEDAETPPTSSTKEEVAPAVPEKAETKVDILDRMSPEEREKELRDQVTHLNAKLVASFNRMSDLEDDLSVAHNRIMVHTTRIAELSKERDQYISALNTGLLVEKAHVTAEMQRMMERVVDEAAQRGKAESDKTRIEAELEELSASLFNEANKMVAVERLARAKAEEKSESLERSLHHTEQLMSEQQDLIKSMQSDLESLRLHPEAESAEASTVMEPSSMAASVVVSPPTVNVNIPAYQEFLSFLHHLRGLHQQLSPYFEMVERGTDWTKTPPAPGAMSLGGVVSPAISGSPSVVRHRDYPHLPISAEQLVQLSGQTTLPFIKRMQEEDSDPCLRLSHAPGLNWLARRQATTALLDGNVVIEPLFAGGRIENEEALRAEYGVLAPTPCALCGTPLLNVTALVPGAQTSSADLGGLRAAAGGLAYSLRDSTSSRRSLPSLFHSLRRGIDRSQSSSPQPDGRAETKESTEIFSQDMSSPQLTDSLPIPTHYFRISDHASGRHLICTHHCLQRLRVVCAFWSFLRTLERAIVLEGKVEPEVVGQTRILPSSQEAPKASSDAAPVPDVNEQEGQVGPTAEPASPEKASTDTTEAAAISSKKDSDESDDEEIDVFDEAMGDAVQGDTSASKDETVTAAAPPPPLPARRPSTPNVHGPLRTSFPWQSDRTHLAWEESLWAEVLRYKELMWKARVGIDLTQLDIV
ncbi:guanyl-nucleotide exchange factor [Malassezia pachydermatis]|uniref:GDP/GTP exchange factor Sec2 N-terminal domain-containing protein n=1 Tax=Malassezia pachydermatis TaxID=77020 RepID=A0A0M9VPL2_9BASI|nr:hypothetical protein Malapachy_0781 [Malassezia pachydermatis]KOS14549.1 hypothetical protein Malapachy_0781 [Malassezia pachydermatis]